MCYSVDFLERAIDSVLKQEYPNIEYIVVYGSFTDDTLDILKRRSKGYLHYISELYKGIYDATNKGIALSAGDRILLLWGGDYLCPEFSTMCKSEFCRDDTFEKYQ